MITVRTEAPNDIDVVRAVHQAAFDTPAESVLVDALRATSAWLPDLSLVATRNGDVVGHLLLSEARLDRGHAVLALAPMAVAPGVQRQGVGGLLVRTALARAARTSYPLVVVLGHPGYYPRFGFTPARDAGVEPPFDVPDDAWMLVKLPAYTVDARGTVVYPPPFAAV